MLAIETRDLVKRFGTLNALQSVDLAVPEGVVFGLIGPNGAGKSTLMRILLDLLRRTSGEVRVLGRDPRREGVAIRREVGYLPGEIRLDPRQHGRALLRAWAGLNPGDGAALQRAEALAEQLQLDTSRRTSKLSKGNKQKIGIIQALMHRPRLLILDEPTSGLDPILQQQVLELFAEAARDGATVFLSSHILSEIEHIADQAAVLREGTIVQSGSVADLRKAAGRQVRITIEAGDASRLQEELEEFASDVQAREHNGQLLLSAVLQDQVPALIEFCARHHAVDLLCEEPSLEQSVLSMYRRS